MKLACCAILLVVGCHKGNKTAETAGSGSAGSAQVTGSATTGSAMTGSATTGSAVGASQHVAAVDELDRWLAPALRLDPHARVVALAPMVRTLDDKAKALEQLGPPQGVEAQTWKDAVDQLDTDINGVGLCTQDLAGYDKLSKEAKDVADDNYKDCTKGLPDSFAAVVKLVPGAKPAGTHANDPVMTPPSK